MASAISSWLSVGKRRTASKAFFEQFCHESKIRSNRPKWKGMRQTSDLQGYGYLGRISEA
jgi:hypothetical protein